MKSFASILKKSSTVLGYIPVYIVTFVLLITVCMPAGVNAASGVYLNFRQDKTTETKVVSGIPLGSRLIDVAERVSPDYRISATDTKNNTLTATDLVGTGYALNLFSTNSEESLISYVVVYGDVDSDGYVTEKDVKTLSLYYLDSQKLEGALSVAARVTADNEDSNPSMTMRLLIAKQQVHGYKNIDQKYATTPERYCRTGEITNEDYGDDQEGTGAQITTSVPQNTYQSQASSYSGVTSTVSRLASSAQVSSAPAYNDGYVEKNTVDEIINDLLASSHEGIPHGVPLSYSWAQKPRFGKSPSDYQYKFTFWGQVYEAREGTLSTNTRVQLRNMYAYAHLKSTNKWVLLQSGDMQGALYPESFQGQVKSASLRNESSNGGGISVVVGDGYNFHFYPLHNSRRSLFLVADSISDIDALFTTVQSRLVVDDSNKADDRSKAYFVLGVGGDIWSDDNKNNDICIGRHKYVKNYWRSYNGWWSTDKTGDIIRNCSPLDPNNIK